MVLYSSSQVDKRKAGRLAEAIQVAFQELGVFPTSNTKIPLQDDDAMPFQKVQVVENIERVQDLKKIVNPMNGTLMSAAETQSLQGVQQTIETALSPEIQRHEVSMSMRPEGLVIHLEEIGFFDSGTATIRPGSLGAITRLAGVLKQLPENLRVEGHTDNVPIHNDRFASNWELSASRSTEVIRLFITSYGLAPDRLSAAGYAEFHPISTNGTAAGRAQNRRVDVVVLAAFRPSNADTEHFNQGPPPVHGP